MISKPAVFSFELILHFYSCRIAFCKCRKSKEINCAGSQFCASINIRSELSFYTKRPDWSKEHRMIKKFKRRNHTVKICFFSNQPVEFGGQCQVKIQDGRNCFHLIYFFQNNYLIHFYLYLLHLNLYLIL